MNAGGRPLNWSFDPLEALRRWPIDRQILLLHSGRLNRQWARWSILASPVGVYRYVTDNSIAADQVETQYPSGESQWLGPPELCPIGQFSNKPFNDLDELLLKSEGIWIGYLGYDLGRWVEHLPIQPCQAKDDRGWPLIELGYCPGYLVYDLKQRQWSACGSWKNSTTQSDLGFPSLAENPASGPVVVGTGLTSGFDRQTYEQCVTQAKQYIVDGDVFQVNLAQRLTADLCHEAFEPHQKSTVNRSLYCQLAKASPAWYGAYLELADFAEHNPIDRVAGYPAPSQRAIISTSPELFLQVNDRSVITRPIKGTRPAHVDENELRHSEKDMAELNMIIDLMRNDLGRVCDYGSVAVTQDRVIESHPTVHHGVATIQGSLHRSKGIVDLLRATLPAGSVTGAPKVRAMQIIDQLEPVRRGPYCGAIGFLSRDRTCLNVAIRTMLADQSTGCVDFSVGGAIVADSVPSLEYQETLDKAAAMLSALQPLRTSQIKWPQQNLGLRCAEPDPAITI